MKRAAPSIRGGHQHNRHRLPPTAELMRALMSCRMMNSNMEMRVSTNDIKWVCRFTSRSVLAFAFKKSLGLLVARAVLSKLLFVLKYSPDVAPSDFHLYLKLKEFLGGKRFGNDEELENAVTTWLNELATEEYDMGILQLVDKCDKCLNVGDDYVESEGSFRYATE
ncbi:hypothetical protein AVEN_5469-1 [Araneus ventricosus]|uniref:Uncharacterized protein n=1 Tax=Araneus ventricosus TaxID=182803 RepID=A0A4Y2DXT1_ARAVE|nr:hypothetical protein AVEN_5469-1 [Araneus ventricosus]